MRNFLRKQQLILLVIFAGSLIITGCEPAANSNINVNRPVGSNSANANSVVNTNSTSAVNTNSGNNSATATIETREPEIYQADVTLKLETMGAQQGANLPPIAAQVARNGADRRMAFTLPNKEKVVYLNAAGKTYLISPDRKQFAELNQESLGFEIRSLMTPTQIVNQVKNLKGVERIGEEIVNGRTAVKYRLNTKTDTKTQAGNVQTESVILVDKETGLPLRSETNSESASGAAVKGVSGLRLVTEMSNIQTDVAPDMFNLPTDYKQVAPEEVRSQVTAYFSVASALLGSILKNSPPANSPTASPAP